MTILTTNKATNEMLKNDLCLQQFNTFLEQVKPSRLTQQITCATQVFLRSKKENQGSTNTTPLLDIRQTMHMLMLSSAQKLCYHDLPHFLHPPPHAVATNVTRESRKTQPSNSNLLIKPSPLGNPTSDSERDKFMTQPKRFAVGLARVSANVCALTPKLSHRRY